MSQYIYNVNRGTFELLPQFPQKISLALLAAGIFTVIGAIFLALALHQALPHGVNGISSLGGWGYVASYGTLAVGIALLAVGLAKTFLNSSKGHVHDTYYGAAPDSCVESTDHFSVPVANGAIYIFEFLLGQKGALQNIPNHTANPENPASVLHHMRAPIEKSCETSGHPFLAAKVYLVDNPTIVRLVYFSNTKIDDIPYSIQEIDVGDADPKPNFFGYSQFVNLGAKPSPLFNTQYSEIQKLLSGKTATDLNQRTWRLAQ